MLAPLTLPVFAGMRTTASVPLFKPPHSPPATSRASSPILPAFALLERTCAAPTCAAPHPEIMHPTTIHPPSMHPATVHPATMHSALVPNYQSVSHLFTAAAPAPVEAAAPSLSLNKSSSRDNLRGCRRPRDGNPLAWQASSNWLLSQTPPTPQQPTRTADTTVSAMTAAASSPKPLLTRAPPPATSMSLLIQPRARAPQHETAACHLLCDDCGGYFAALKAMSRCSTCYQRYYRAQKRKRAQAEAPVFSAADLFGDHGLSFCLSRSQSEQRSSEPQSTTCGAGAASHECYAGVSPSASGTHCRGDAPALGAGTLSSDSMEVWILTHFL